MMDKILEQTEQYGKMHNNSVIVKPDGLCSNQGMAYVSDDASYCVIITLCRDKLLIDTFDRLCFDHE